MATPLTNYTTASSIMTYNPPVYSPDGQTIAFLSNQDPTKTTEATIDGYNLWTVKRDGTGLSAVTTYIDGELSAYAARPFDWSPDGTLLAYTATPRSAVSDRRDTETPTTYQNVYTVHADGTGITQVTSFNSQTISSSPYPYDVSWSPDGTKIAFISSQAAGTNNAGGNTTGPYNVWTVTQPAGALFCVSCSASINDVYGAFYAKSGTAIIFEGNTQAGDVNPANIYSVNDDGTAVTNLTNYTNESNAPYGAGWHLDNATILYQYYADDTWGVWAVPAVGGTPQPLFTTPDHNANTPYSNEEDD